MKGCVLTNAPRTATLSLHERAPQDQLNRLSSTQKAVMTIVYTDSPQRDRVDLTATVNLPNLTLDVTKLDFGCILNETYKRGAVTLTNVSLIDAVYEWSFLEDDEAASEAGSARSGPARPLAPPSQVFDILPIRGVIKPGASELIEFSFFALPGSRASCVAVCDVDGGPEYAVSLRGEADVIKYSLDQSVVTVPPDLFFKTVERDITLQNTGKVPFDFAMDLSQLSRAAVLSCSPLEGRLVSGQKQVLKIKIRPGIPDSISEHIFLSVAHFEPVDILVQAEGIYPNVSFSLPRADDTEYDSALALASSRLALSGPRVVVTPGRDRSSASRGAKAGGRAAKPPATAESKRPPTNAGLAAEASFVGDGGIVSGFWDSSSAEGKPVYVPTSAEVEIEADRLSLCRAMVRREETLLAAGGTVEALLNPPKKAPVATMTLANYVLDFGNIIKVREGTEP